MTETWIMDAEIFDNPVIFERNYNKIPDNSKEKLKNYVFAKDRNLSLCSSILLTRGLKQYGIDINDIHIRNKIWKIRNTGKHWYIF